LLGDDVAGADGPKFLSAFPMDCCVDPAFSSGIDSSPLVMPAEASG
jgi:hypothetical protein